MKKIILILLLFMTGYVAVAQKKKKNVNTTFKVHGVCMMCKQRIEKAALSVKGVKYAVWNVNSKDLNLIFDLRKTNALIVKECIAKVGHDTEEIKATEKAYHNLHPCCKYRDLEVKEHHKEGS